MCIYLKVLIYLYTCNFLFSLFAVLSKSLKYSFLKNLFNILSKTQFTFKFYFFSFIVNYDRRIILTKQVGTDSHRSIEISYKSYFQEQLDLAISKLKEYHLPTHRWIVLNKSKNFQLFSIITIT